MVIESHLAAQSDLVDADSARMQQVVWNLVKNAVKFTPSGGRIRVTTQTAGEDRVEVEVRDTGKGISPEALPFIFDAFEQGAPSITQQFGGLGLGLSIAEAIVDRHGGAVRAASDGPARGSSFTLTLPLLPSSRADRGDGDVRRRRHDTAVAARRRTTPTLPSALQAAGALATRSRGATAWPGPESRVPVLRRGRQRSLPTGWATI